MRAADECPGDLRGPAPGRAWVCTPRGFVRWAPRGARAGSAADGLPGDRNGRAQCRPRRPPMPISESPTTSPPVNGRPSLEVWLLTAVVGTGTLLAVPQLPPVVVAVVGEGDTRQHRGTRRDGDDAVRPFLSDPSLVPPCRCRSPSRRPGASAHYFRCSASLTLSTTSSALSSALSITSSTLSFAWSSFSLASPARRSALPSDSRSLLPVRLPAASLTRPSPDQSFSPIVRHLSSSRGTWCRGWIGREHTFYCGAGVSSLARGDSPRDVSPVSSSVSSVMSVTPSARGRTRKAGDRPAVWGPRSSPRRSGRPAASPALVGSPSHNDRGGGALGS